jgi:hypothetical protein
VSGVADSVPVVEGGRMLKLLKRMAAFDGRCPHGRRGRVCARSVPAVAADLDEIVGAASSMSGRSEGNLPTS